MSKLKTDKSGQLVTIGARWLTLKGGKGGKTFAECNWDIQKIKFDPPLILPKKSEIRIVFTFKEWVNKKDAKQYE